jgi:hypothetical protein
VHRHLGPGWEEAVYRDAVVLVLEEKGESCVPVDRDTPVATGGWPADLHGAAFVSYGTILVLVSRGPVADRSLPLDLRAADLDRAVVLGFGADGVEMGVIDAQPRALDLPV